MNRNRILIAMSLVAWLAMFLGCSDDNKNPIQPPQFGEISGTVKLVGAWPANGDVQISVWSSWPPAGPPAYASSVFAAGNYSPTYKIDGVNKRSYPVVTVGWRDPANPAAARVLGIYWANSDSVGVADGRGTPVAGVLALPITVTDGSMKFNAINIKANLNFAQ